MKRLWRRLEGLWFKRGLGSEDRRGFDLAVSAGIPPRYVVPFLETAKRAARKG
jgi:hypothetical protein